MECSPPGSSAHGSCAGKNAGVACPCLRGIQPWKRGSRGNLSEQIRRWGSLGIRGWGPPGWTQFGTVVFLSVSMWKLRCYGPQSLCLGKGEENWEELRVHGSPLDFAWLPWGRQPSVAAPRVFACLHSGRHLLFCCLTHYKSPDVLEQLNLCPFTLSGSEHCEELGI